MFKGSNTALVTPFREEGIDEVALEEMVVRQIDAGTHGLVPCGTTGESPCLGRNEHLRVIEVTVKSTQGKVPVIAGCGSNSTSQTIDLCQRAEKLGVNAFLIVCPYYNRPSQQGLFLHFKAIAKATGLPIIIYNIPGRTAVDMSAQTMARLYEACDNIVGVKDATGGVTRVAETTRLLGPEFIQLCGDDILALEFNKLGGVGCISVTSNIAPKICADFQNLCLSGDFAAAGKIHTQLEPLNKGLFVETNPVPVKYAASLLGLCQPDVRLPLAPLSGASKAVVEKAMKASGLEF